MNEGKNKEIHERIYQFVLSVLRYIKILPRSFENQVLVAQLIRSVTSIGANDQEAAGTFTRADFAHCYTLVRKEAKESLFWLRLLGDCNSGSKFNTSRLLVEGDEIVRVVTAIIFSTKKK